MTTPESDPESDSPSETEPDLETESESASEIEWLTLDADEELLWHGEPHQGMLVLYLIIGFPLIILFFFGLLIIVAGYLHYDNMEYAITSKALYKKTGAFGRNVQRIDLNKVQNTSYGMSKLFDHGGVRISTAGGQGIEMKFGWLSEPEKIHRFIEEKSADVRQESHAVRTPTSEQTTTPTQTDESRADDVVGGEELLTELRAIREAVESVEATLSDDGESTTEQEQ